MSRRRAYPQPQYSGGAGPDDSALTSPGLGGGQYRSPGLGLGLGIPPSQGLDHTSQQMGRLSISGSNSMVNSPFASQGGQFSLFQASSSSSVNPSPQVNNQYQTQFDPAFGGGVGVGGAAGGFTPFNELYTTDLSRELPPPISDLSLPPPPIVLAPNLCLNQDLETANASPDYFRSTLNVIPNTSALLRKSKLPLALVFHPYNALKIEDEPIPVTSDTHIGRCRRCKGYINPFITLAENGRRWRCNFCSLLNDIPAAFDYDELTGRAHDKLNRVELNHAVVEFLAPKEYMVRTPSPVVYTFIIDVSISAIQNGLVGTISRTILESLDRIPNTNKTAKVAFIAVDSNLHFFRFKQGLLDQEVETMIVSDIEDPFIPSPDGLLVNLDENRPIIEKFLLDFPTYFQDTMNQGFALGPALIAGHRLINHVGGKLVCLTATLPNLGNGKLTVRDENSVAGKPKEAKTLLTAADVFYKQFAVDCNSCQVTVDVFLTGAGYQDVATLSTLPRFTAGQTHYYSNWKGSTFEDVAKLSKEVSDHLSQDFSSEAVLRVRGSSACSMSSFYGNFFNRSSDICSFPTFPRDQSYTFEVAIEENIKNPVVYFQAAILHSTSFGERRVRVFNLAIPTSGKLNEVYASADQLAITNYYTHKAIEKALSSSFPEAKDFLTNKVVDILNVYKKELVAGNVSGASPLQLSTNLRMLPLLLFSLSKSLTLRGERVPSDHRASALNALTSLPINQLVKYIYPTVYSLHDISDECGLPQRLISIDQETGEETEYFSPDILLPEPINDSKISWENYGLYLIDNASELFLWVSGNVVPGLIQDLFGTEQLYTIPTGKSELPELGTEPSDFNYRVRQIIGKLREQNGSIIRKHLYVVIGGSSNEPIEISQQRDLMALRMWVYSCLVEDKTGSEPTYRDFLTSLKAKIV